MTRYFLMALVATEVWITCLVASDPPKTIPETNAIGVSAALDAAVLEEVLVDLLTRPDSPVEAENPTKGVIYFSAEAVHRQIQAADILRTRDDKKLQERLSAEQLADAREAAVHLAQRAAEKVVFKDFVPNDTRIRMYSKEQAAKDKESTLFNRRQVFCAFSPGYSQDKDLAVVRFVFTWSGGFHGATGLFVLAKQKDGWVVLIKDLFYYS